jgi:hypothetical protein
MISVFVTESFALTKNLLPFVEVVREVSGIGQPSSTVNPVRGMFNNVPGMFSAV